jgi:hypothetical protein
VFKDQLWVIGGGRGATKTNPGFYLDDVWVSRNGMDWKQAVKKAAFPARVNPVCLVFGDKMWVMGGFGIEPSGKTVEYRDVWSSPDGIDWQKETGNLPLKGERLSGVVFGGRMWLFRGVLASSRDGVTWTVEPAVPSVSGFDGAALAAYKDRLWLFCDQPPAGMTAQQAFESGVFVTKDGKSWGHPFLGSEVFWLRGVGPTFVEFDEKLWLLGGAWERPSYRGFNDVWAGTLLE